MLFRIQDGSYELRYESQSNGKWRLIVYDGHSVPYIFRENVPTLEALKHFSFEMGHRVLLQLDRILTKSDVQAWKQQAAIEAREVLDDENGLGGESYGNG